MTAPTLDELRKRWEAGKKIIRDERAMRATVFPPSDARRKGKLAEMDELLEILTWMKDAIKPHCEPEYEQPALLDVPADVKQERRAEFN